MRALAVGCLVALAACSPAGSEPGDADTIPDGAAPGSDSAPAGFAFACARSFPGECGCWPPSAVRPAAVLLAHCGAADVGAPSLCCALPGWQADRSVPQECECTQIECAALGDECACRSLVNRIQGATTVASCTGTTCCRRANDCTCFTGAGFTCPSAADQVPSCAPSDVKCGDTLSETVPTCA